MATPQNDPLNAYETELRTARANAQEIEERADFYKARAGFVWIAAAWLVVAPIVGYVTWLVVR